MPSQTQLKTLDLSMSSSMASNMSFYLTCIFSLLAAIVCAIIFMKKKSNEKKKQKQNSAGQYGLPLIGETMEFYKAQQTNKLFESLFNLGFKSTGRSSNKAYGIANGHSKWHGSERFFLSNEFKLVISSWPSSSVQLMGIDSIMENKGNNTVPSRNNSLKP